MARHRTQDKPVKPGTPIKPAGLSAQASIEWDRLLGEIQASGIQVTVAHRAAISLASTIAADIKADWAEIQKQGRYHAAEKGGVLMHPAVKRMDALRRDYLKALSVIGLRPGLPSEQSDGPSLADELAG